jgi:carbohydrate-binding DOMON domain-containing protein
MEMRVQRLFLVLMAGLLVAGSAAAADLVFTDPTGDDNGPGAYTYPTDAVYTPGSFDLTELKVATKGDKVDFAVTVNAKLDDPWAMKVGFATQMVFIFIDTDRKEGSGSTVGLPGLNITFAPCCAWDRVVILSPQSANRARNEVDMKVAADLKDKVVVPDRTKGVTRTISGSVKLADLGGGDPATWGYQVVMQSNEGFPDKADLLTRKVNEFEGQHRFGGGTDYDCDPHAMDILDACGKTQKEQLAYECNGDGTAKTMATLHMATVK